MSYDYWGDLWLNEAALRLFEELLGYELPRDGEDDVRHGSHSCTCTPIELDHSHIEFSGEFSFGNKLEKMVWDAWKAGHFIEGRWAEQGQIDGFWMTEWHLGQDGSGQTQFRTRSISFGADGVSLGWQDVNLETTTFVVVSFPKKPKDEDDAIPVLQGPMVAPRAMALLKKMQESPKAENFVLALGVLEPPSEDPCRHILESEGAEPCPK